MAQYLEQVEKTPSPIHQGMLVGGGTVRMGVAGFTPGELAKQEVAKIQAQLQLALDEGALGISLGLG